MSNVRLTGRRLAELLRLSVNHALYREDGSWYHQLTYFPGVLFDRYGYVIFATEAEFRNSPYLQIQEDLHVPGGISTIPNYVRIGDFYDLINVSGHI